MQKQRRYDGVVMGPDGNPLTLDDLPPAGTTRWVIRRKAEVVAAVRGGLLTMEEDWITVTPKGRLTIRNICMVFDRYLAVRADGPRHSQTV